MQLKGCIEKCLYNLMRRLSQPHEAFVACSRDTVSHYYGILCCFSFSDVLVDWVHRHKPFKMLQKSKES